MIQFEEWEKESLTKAHINYAHDCWRAAQEAILAELEREVEERMKQGQRRASVGDGRLSQIALIEAREDENILTLIRSKKGGGK